MSDLEQPDHDDTQMPPSYPPQERAVPSKSEPEKRPAKLTAPTPRQRVGSFFLEFATIIAVALLISVIIKTFFAQAFAIPSESMENTLIPGDRIFVNKLADSEGELNRGDVVVFVDPGNWLEGVAKDSYPAWQQVLVDVGEAVGLIPQNVGDHLVKRIIGLPGDHVKCCNGDGLITVNGEPIKETYLKPGVSPSDTPFDVIVPDGHLWLMGDNRNRSKDARYHQQATGFGFVPITNVEGRAWVTIFPLDRFGTIPSASDVFANVPSAK
ncbi:signal peptidase I [Trueperella pecoris]|uniref:Signal peptidase I n=1 Tax=Trueperella pecoris TaxID=2733571 RepID=A0A7M1R2M6_9ACTO|nr:signal peptidase I [Trueperella pecoris]QOR48356.1 signal peptidase I [Trueperella pecoris]